MASAKTWVLTASIATLVIAGGVALRVTLFADREAGASAEGPVPVEVAAVERGPIERRRELTGTLEASAEFTVAPKVAGRVVRVHVDLADPVTRGQVVAELDDDELDQARAQSRADLSVARAEVAAASKNAELAQRNFDRVAGLHGRDIASEQELDAARSDKTAAEAELEGARAALARARAGDKAAKIRRDDTEIRADWSGDDERRLVAERYADEGSMLGANQPLLKIVDIDPVIAVVFVTESDYAQLSSGMPVEIRTDAFPGETFAGEITRIAPVFRAESRQARVELELPNADGRLKPGMFVRARAVLERAEEATIVPVAALVSREGETVVFVVDEAGEAVSMRAVEPGIREGERVAVRAKAGGPIRGRVVTLGQQQLVDGAAIVIPTRELPSPEASS